MVYLLKMVIFYSYVKLPEGTSWLQKIFGEVVCSSRLLLWDENPQETVGF